MAMKPLEVLTLPEVCNWLDSIHLGVFREKIESEGYDGCILGDDEFGMQDIVELDCGKKPHQKKFLKAIVAARENGVAAGLLAGAAGGAAAAAGGAAAAVAVGGAVSVFTARIEPSNFAGLAADAHGTQRGGGEFKDVVFSATPATIDEFVTLRDAVGSTPEGAAAIFQLALLLWSDESTRLPLGSAALAVALHADHLASGADYKGKSVNGRKIGDFNRYIGDKPYCARSYFVGTQQAEGYVLPVDGELRVRTKTQPRDAAKGGKARIYVYCSGADTPRPIALKSNSKGVWKADAWSSMLVGVKAPPVGDDGDDL